MTIATVAYVASLAASIVTVMVRKELRSFITSRVALHDARTRCREFEAAWVRAEAELDLSRRTLRNAFAALRSRSIALHKARQERDALVASFAAAKLEWVRERAAKDAVINGLERTVAELRRGGA
jgi:hypothetical protein